MNGNISSDLLNLVDNQVDQMIDIRRQIHQRPELGFEEIATSALIHTVAQSLNLEVLPCPTSTGAVLALQGGKPGKTVLLRADIDALPIQETAAGAFASEIQDVMHACGHDAHVAQMLGTAAVLAQRAEDLPGRYVFLFQPAEEALDGARKMIDGGVLDGINPAALIGCHVSSILPVGLVGLRSGITMAEVAAFTITVHGTGGHGAMATEGSNPLTTAAVIATKLGAVVDGLSLEGTNCSCSAGTLHAGTAANVIPSHATITGTLRTFSESDRTIARQRISDLVAETMEQTACSVDVSYSHSAPPVINDGPTTDLVRRVTTEIFGDKMVFNMPPVSPSDDVSEFLNRIPGTYFFVSAGKTDGSSGMHHTPEFSIDEGCLRIATSIMAAAAVEAAEN